MAVFDLQSARGHIAFGGEVVIGNSMFLFVPNEHGLAAVGSPVDRMDLAHRLAVERAFPVRDINDWMVRLGILESTLPSFAQQRLERSQMGIERRRVGPGQGQGSRRE